MSINEKDIDIIDRYFLGQLSEQESYDFNERIEDDHNFFIQVEEVKNLSEGIKRNTLQEKKLLLQDWDKEIEEKDKTTIQQPKSTPKRRAQFYKYLIGIAASLLILSIFTYQNTQENRRRQKIIEQYFIHVPSGYSPIRSNSLGEYSQLKQKAFSLYEIKAYEEAAPLLFKVYKIEQDTFSLYLSGVSYLGVNNLRKAREVENELLILRYKSSIPNFELIENLIYANK